MVTNDEPGGSTRRTLYVRLALVLAVVALIGP